MQVNFGCDLPGMVPRQELSKNCLGQVLDSSSEVPPTSKNLLLGESSSETFGESSSFLGESRIFLGVTKHFLGELRRLVESELIGKALLVGVHGDDGTSISALPFTFSLMALFFHLLISACWLDTKLWTQRQPCQKCTKGCDESHELSHLIILPFQFGYFDLKLSDFLLQLGLLQQNAALDHQTPGVSQSGMKILALQDWI